MSIATEFVMTLTFRGHSLGEIDDAIVNAGGERLRARMTNPPVGPLGVPTFGDASAVGSTNPLPAAIQTVERASAPGGLPNSYTPPEEPRKETRGRKPGTKNKSKEFSESMVPAETEETSEHDMAEMKAHFESGPAVPDTQSGVPARKLTEAELKQCAQAMKHVNSKVNIDAARKCLDKFEVVRCADLTADKLQAFIDHCMSH